MKLRREVEVPLISPRDRSALAAGFLAGMGWMLALALSAATMSIPVGCCAKRPPPVSVVTVMRGCIDHPRPQRPTLSFDGRVEGCPDRWEACLVLDSAVRLQVYITDLERWADNTEIACKKDVTP